MRNHLVYKQVEISIQIFLVHLSQKEIFPSLPPILHNFKTTATKNGTIVLKRNKKGYFKYMNLFV